MTRQELIEALTNLEKIMSRLNNCKFDVEAFQLITRMVLACLVHSNDESVEVDAIVHLEQAKRLLGAGS